MTSTELGYLSGVTSNIQDQLNGKAGVGSNNSFGDVDEFENWSGSGPFVLWCNYPIYTNNSTYVGFAFGYSVAFDANSMYQEIKLLAYTDISFYRHKQGGTWSIWYPSIMKLNFGSSLPGNGLIDTLFFLKST